MPSADPPRPERLYQVTRSATHVVERIARMIATACTLLLMVVTGVDVFLRATTGQGVPGSVELVEVVLVVAVFLGMMPASLDGMHIRATLVTGLLRPSVARIVRFIGTLFACGAAAWLFYGASLRAMISVGKGEYRFGLVQVSVWPARIAMAVGLLGLLIALALHAITILRDNEPQHWKR